MSVHSPYHITMKCVKCKKEIEDMDRVYKLKFGIIDENDEFVLIKKIGLYHEVCYFKV